MLVNLQRVLLVLLLSHIHQVESAGSGAQTPGLGASTSRSSGEIELAIDIEGRQDPTSVRTRSVEDLPEPAEPVDVIPHAHTLEARKDFSLPEEFRSRTGTFSDWPEQGDTEVLEEILPIHLQNLEKLVPIPMERRFPRMKELQVRKFNRDIMSRVVHSLDNLPHHRWLLNGKQAIMLHRAKLRLREIVALSGRQLTVSDDPNESRILRSHLDANLLRTHRLAKQEATSSLAVTFPQILKAALHETWEDLREGHWWYRKFPSECETAWKSRFPYLFDPRIDILSYLLHT